METADEILERQRREQAERDAEIQRQQEATRQQIASNAQSSQQQFGLGNGINNGMSGVRNGKNIANMFGTTGSGITASSGFTQGGTLVGEGAVQGMSGTWGSVAGGGAASSGGAAAGGAAGGSSGAMSGLAAAGPWAALAAAVIGHNEWADRKGLRDGESFKGEYGLTGRALYKDKDYYAERADKIIPGLGDSVNIGGSLSSPADMFRGETWKGIGKSALKGGVVGGLLKKIF
ncbi:hypothetical protein D3C87_1316520 [compost metagenome]